MIIEEDLRANGYYIADMYGQQVVMADSHYFGILENGSVKWAYKPCATLGELHSALGMVLPA